MDPPPPPATHLIPSHIPHSYAESMESSPRSRTTETWDDRESLSAAAAAQGGGKLRLMCSYGGHIIPRPHDKSLSYVGGDTRMVVVDRNISLGELQTRLSRNLLQSQLFTLKYQLPNEDLDSLISVTSDEDLENMIDEFDRICATSSVAKSSRLRVFLFMNARESASSIEWILDGSVKSEDWFFNTLNGSKSTPLGFSDTKSVNSLLGLDNALKNGVNQREVEADLSRNQKSNSHQNAQLTSESVVFDASSSFGSTTSSLVNLPPIRVRVEGGGGGVNGGNKFQDQGVAGVEEQFAQMGVSAGGRQTEAFATMVSPPPPIPTSLIPAAAIINPDRELTERIVEDDERSDQGVPVGYVVVNQTQPQLQTQSQRQQKPNAMFDIASPKSASSEGGMLYQEQAGHNNSRTQGQQKAFEAGYVMHSQFEQQQLQQQLQQLQQHQQNQQHHQSQQQHQQNQQHHHQQQQHQQNQQNQQQHQQHQQQQQHQQHQQHQQQQEHLQQQQQQQQEHLQQQQQQQHQQQQQQQHQQQQQNHQQQFVQPGTHYNQQSHNAVPMSQYYHLYPPPTQRHQPQLDQQQYPFYFIPPTTRQPLQGYNNMSMQQATYIEPSNTAPSSLPQTPPAPAMTSNPSAYNNQPRNMAPDNPEMVSNDYRTGQSMVQLAPGQQQQQYMTYSQVHHAPQTMTMPQNSPSAANSSYVFEYADPAHAQIYSTQPLSHPASYQTMVSSSQMMPSDASSAQNSSDK